MLMFHNDYACYEVVVGLVYSTDGKPAIGDVSINDMFTSRSGSIIADTKPNTQGIAWLLIPVSVKDVPHTLKNPYRSL